MDNVNLSDTEQRVQDFQSRLRVDYSAKIQEVAYLTDVVAKLQTQLLDVEYENNALRQQLIVSQNEIGELRKSISAGEKDNATQLKLAVSSFDAMRSSRKHERSLSVEAMDSDTDMQPTKKGKAPSYPTNPTLQAQISCEASSSGTTVLSNTRAASGSSSSPEQILPQSLVKDKRDGANLSLLPSVVQEHLQAADALYISPSPTISEVSVGFLQVNYGGKLGASLTTCQKKNNPSGKWARHILLQDLDQSPYMPRSPGHSGLLVNFPLYFVPGVSMWTVFRTQRRVDNITCQYLGEYTIAPVGKMSAECFAAQASAAKQNWAKLVLKRRKNIGCRDVCARIALRFASVIPLDDEEEEKRLIQEEVVEIQAGKGRPISKDYIIDAFSNGEETIDIFLMKCLSYDHVFATDIETRVANGTAT